jgi:hypothetical protein
MKKCLLALVVLFASSAANAQTTAALMQLAKLTASDGANYSQFGTYAAISGNTAVVGDYGAQNEVYVFEKGPNGWMDTTESAKLVSSDGFVSFSQEAAISGNTIVVYGYDYSTNTYGVYIFEKPAGGWTGSVTETAILSGFYGVVAISGNTIVVGGGTYNLIEDVFVRPAGGWKTTTQANATLTIPMNYYYGSVLAISGNTVVVSAPQNFGEGTLYVFVKPSTGWSGNLNPTATLIASNGRPSDALGTSVSVSGNTIVAGAPYANAYFGAVYVFVQPTGGWKDSYETAELMAPNTIDLGLSVSISGNAIVAGSPGSTVGFNQGQGAAYVYLKPASGWKSTSTPNLELSATDGAPGDALGYSVAISGSTVLAGAPLAKIGSNYTQGAAYVFGK